MHFRASGPFGNCRGRDLELNALIGIEIDEILEFCQKFVFLENVRGLCRFLGTVGGLWSLGDLGNFNFFCFWAFCFFFVFYFFAWSGNCGGRLRG